jgi:hypothetical protein
MKKITLLCFLLTAFLGFSQQQQYNLGFETSTPSGNLSSWVSFENPAPGLSIVTNPMPNGVNTSATTKVMKVDLAQASACFAGMINSHGTFGTWQLVSSVPSNLTLSMQVNKSIVGKIGIKFANATNGTVFEITGNEGSVTAVNQWVTLTWNISGFNVGDNVNIDQMVVFVDWRCTGEVARPSDAQILIDNITWGANKLTDPVVASCSDGIQNGDETGIDCGGTCPACPTPMVAAPTPPARNAADVVSIYSNAYANVALSELPTSWSQLATFTPIQIQGNDTWKMTGCEFLGMVTNYGTGVDVSLMENMHIDYWTPNNVGIGVKIVNTVNIGEALASLGTTVTGTWQSINVPMSAFAALPNKTKITQLLIDPASPISLYIDNFYFYKGQPLGVSSFVKPTVTIYPNPSKGTLNISSDIQINSIIIYNTLGQVVLTKSLTPNETSIDVSSLSKGVYVLSTQIENEIVRKQFIKN